MSKVLAAPPTALPSTDPFPVMGSAPARDARFGTVLRGWLREATPNDGDSAEASDALVGEPAAGPALTMPWLLLLTASAADTGDTATATVPAQGGTTGTASPAGEGVPSPAGASSADAASVRAPAVTEAGQPNAPGSPGQKHGAPVGQGGAGTDSPPAAAQNSEAPIPTPGPDPAGNLFAQAADEEPPAPTPRKQATSAGERDEGWSLAALWPAEVDGRARLSPELAAPGRPLARPGEVADTGRDPTPMARSPLRLAEEGVAERRELRADGTAPTTARFPSPGVTAGSGVTRPSGTRGGDPASTLAFISHNAAGTEGVAERGGAEDEGPAAAPLPLVRMGLVQGAPDDVGQMTLTPGRPLPHPIGARSGTPLPQVGEGLGVRVGEGIASAPRPSAVAQVAAALVLSARDGVTEVTITLRPPELGEVRARIVAGPDGLVIRLSAEHEAVGALLRARAGELQQALTAQQVPVVEVHVLHNPPAYPSLQPAPREGEPGWAEWPRREPGQQERQSGGGAQREAEDEA